MNCPECGKCKLIKFGIKFGAKDKVSNIRPKVQQYRCLDCGRVTIKPVMEVIKA